MLCLLVVVVMATVPSSALAQEQIPPPTSSFRLETRCCPVKGLENKYPVKGTVYMYTSDPEGPVDWPVIITDGFDHGNMRTWNSAAPDDLSLYQYFNQSGMIEKGKEAGIDFFILDFDGGSSLIQFNGHLLIELINWINARNPQRELVVLGPSMGGLVARYSLAFMESQGMWHNTRLFISFDTPHVGANIPLGLQDFVWFFSHQFSVLRGPNPTAVANLQALNSPAARQMLVLHYDHPPGQGASNERFTLIEHFRQLGNYPQLLRKVAISNGSGTGVGQSFSPRERLFHWNHKSVKATINAEVWALPNQPLGGAPVLIVKAEARGFEHLDPAGVKRTVRSTHPWDNSPGGTRPSLLEALKGTKDFCCAQADHPSHTFVPTISALDINTSDLFFNVKAAGKSIYDLTPFDKLYYPSENEKHMLISEVTAQRMLNEIFCSPPQTSNWNINLDCTIEDSLIAPADLIVEGNATLTIVEGGVVDLDFPNHRLRVTPGSKLVVKPGGSIK